MKKMSDTFTPTTLETSGAATAAVTLTAPTSTGSTFAAPASAVSPPAAFTSVVPMPAGPTSASSPSSAEMTCGCRSAAASEIPQPLPLSQGLSMMVPITVNGTKTSAIVDSGSQATLASVRFCELAGVKPVEGRNITISGIGSDMGMSAGIALHVPIAIGNGIYHWTVIIGDIRENFLLGMDFLHEVGASLDFRQGYLRIGDAIVVAEYVTNVEGQRFAVAPVKINEKAVIAAAHSQVLECDISERFELGSTVIMEPLPIKFPISFPACVIDFQSHVNVAVANLANSFVTLPIGTVVATAWNVDAVLPADSNSFDGVKTPFDCVDPETSPDPHEDSDVVDGIISASVTMKQEVTSDIESDILISHGVLSHGKLGAVFDTPQVSAPTEHQVLVGTKPTSQQDNHPTLSTDPGVITGTLTPEMSSSADTSSAIPDHLTQLYLRSTENLKGEECGSLQTLLSSYSDVFAKHDFDLGEFSTIMHRIDTGDAAPVRHGLRRTPLGFQKEEEAHLQKMLQHGVIQPSASEWAAAPVIVKKKDGKYRYCVNYRSLNKLTRKDSFPLPLIEECLDALADAAYFSTLDMASGYWQILIDPADRHKTAFITKYGLFEHVRLAMGLCNSPATYQRIMTYVLSNMLWQNVLILSSRVGASKIT
jgi:hypothetical protein